MRVFEKEKIEGGYVQKGLRFHSLGSMFEYYRVRYSTDESVDEKIIEFCKDMSIVEKGEKGSSESMEMFKLLRDRTCFAGYKIFYLLKKDQNFSRTVLRTMLSYAEEANNDIHLSLQNTQYPFATMAMSPKGEVTLTFHDQVQKKKSDWKSPSLKM